MTILLIIVVAIIVVYLVYDVKVLNLAGVSLFTGGVKTGKSLISVRCAISAYRKAVVKWFIYRYTLGLIPKYNGKNGLLRRLFRGPIEKPLLYSNIPLNRKYIPLRKAHFLRQERFAFKSVVFIDEASLVADSMSFKVIDGKVNVSTKLFFKLFGHETHDGKCIINTQCVRDVHYNIKRSLNSYLWIQSAIKWIPFFYVAKVREMAFLDDTTVNTFDKDVEDSTKLVIIPKWYYYMYDNCCFSYHTDKLPLGDVTMRKPKSLKQSQILSFDGGFDKINE